METTPPPASAAPPTTTPIFGALKIVFAWVATILIIIAIVKPVWIVSSIAGSREEEGLFRKCYYQHYADDSRYDGSDSRYVDHFTEVKTDIKHCKKLSSPGKNYGLLVLILSGFLP